MSAREESIAEYQAWRAKLADQRTVEERREAAASAYRAAMHPAHKKRRRARRRGKKKAMSTVRLTIAKLTPGPVELPVETPTTRFVVSSVTGFPIRQGSGSWSSRRNPQTVYAVLDRAFCCRVVREFHLKGSRTSEVSKRLAVEMAARLNEEHGPWPVVNH